MIEGLPGSKLPKAAESNTPSQSSQLPGEQASFRTPNISSSDGKFPLFRTVTVFFFGMVVATLILGATGTLAFNLKEAVGEALGGVTGITEVTLNQVVDPVTHLIPLSLLPSGHGSGLNADLLDSLHAGSFAMKEDFDTFSRTTSDKITSLETAIGDLGGSLRSGTLAAFFQNATNLITGTLDDARLSANVALLNASQTFTALKSFSAGLTVSGGALTLPPGSITSSFIGSGTVVGSNLASNISLSTSGSLTTTGSGFITSAGLLTASNGFTLGSGALTLPTAAVSDTALSSNIDLLNATQTISGAKTFSSAITGPTATNTLNGLIVSSGNVTLANLTTSTGSLMTTIADSGTAVGFVLGSSTSYVTAGAKLLQVKNNTTVELTLDKDGNLTVNGNLVATGTVQGTQLISTVVTGTAPLVVSSTTQVTNLNASFTGGLTSTQLVSQPQPNLVLNSDFGRRSKWMTFMPETFTDTAGWTQWLGTNGVGAAASNILTAPAGDASWAARSGLSTWRDVRYSAQFKAISTTAVFRVEKFIDSSNQVAAGTDGAGNFVLVKTVAGAPTTVATVAQALTLNNWYWLELTAQGTTYVARLYSSGVSPAAKAPANQVAMISGTITDTVFTSGGYISIHANVASSQWGGLTGDGSTTFGGVYVEGWGPESWVATFSGTKGGQAIGFDESNDAGPNGGQWAITAYIPVTSRTIALDYPFAWNNASTLTRGSIIPATTYAFSAYEKATVASGTQLIAFDAAGYSRVGIIGNSTGIIYGQDSSWTRKTGSLTTSATDEQFSLTIEFNWNNNSTGTAWVQMPQLEQGSVITPWRNAPADDDPIVWRLQMPGTYPTNTTLGTCWCDFEPGDAAGELFLPWDANVTATAQAEVTTTGSAGHIHVAPTVDGTSFQVSGASNVGVARSYWQTGELGFTKFLSGTATKAVAAGKHRFALGGYYSGGGATVSVGPANGLTVIATRGQ